MLKAIRQFFEEQIQPAGKSAGKEAEHALQLSTAALLLEMMHADHEITEAERQTVFRSMQEKFGLSGTEADELLQLAQAEHKESTDYYQFTSLINKHFSPEQKVAVIEHLWRVAYADNALDKYEEHFVRRIADLLYVPHSEFIAAKHRMAARAGD